MREPAAAEAEPLGAIATGGEEEKKRKKNTDHVSKCQFLVFALLGPILSNFRRAERDMRQPGFGLTSSVP